MTDLTNYGTINIKSLETNTVESGIVSSNGDLILQANNADLLDFQVVFSTFSYDPTTPTLSFSLDTQIKGVKDPSDPQDVATQIWVETRILGKEMFDCYWISPTDAGVTTTVASGGTPQAFTIIMGSNGLTGTLTNNTNFSLNTGIVTYNGTKTVSGNVIARVSASSIGSTKVFRITVFQNSTLVNANAISYTRIEDEDYSSGTLYISVNVTLAPSDTLRLGVSDISGATNTTTCNVVAYQFSFLGFLN